MTKLIESLIENNYKEANDVLMEQIAEIVERKMCEMKKMEAARKSEEQLDEANKTKPNSTNRASKEAIRLALTMLARNAGKKVNMPGPKKQTPAQLKQVVDDAKKLAIDMSVNMKQKAHDDALKQKHISDLTSLIKKRQSERNSDPNHPDWKVRDEIVRKAKESRLARQTKQPEENKSMVEILKRLMGKKSVKEELDLEEGLVSTVKRTIDKASGNQQKRLSKKVNQALDDRQKKVLGHLTKDNDFDTDAGKEQFGKDWKTLLGDKRYNSLIKRYRVTDQRKFYKDHPIMRTTDYLSGKGKPKEKTTKERVDSAAAMRKSRFSVDRYISKPIKESSVSDDIDLVKLAHDEAKEVKKRERDKQPKKVPDSAIASLFNKPKSKSINEISNDLIRRAADSAYDKAVKSKRKGFTTAEKIYNQQGERFDDALEKRRMRDNEKAEMNTLSPAKRRKFFKSIKEDAKQEENIDEGKITKMLPGAIRKQIVKFKAERHYGKAREKAGEEYSAAVKSKDIMKSYPAAMKMGRLGRKARNPGKQVIEKGKMFFRGKQQNEELMLPSGQVMMSTGEVVEQSVAKARRGLN